MDERLNVLWLGSPPEDGMTREMAHRHLSLEPVPSLDALASVGRACAVILSFPAGGCALLTKTAAEQVPALIDCGLRVELISPDDATTGIVQRSLGEIIGLANVHVRTAPACHELAEGVARFDAGTRPRPDLLISVAHGREPIRRADAPLFQRAFNHCREIVLVELTGGMSDARVFAVHMTVDTSNAGVWPQPAFVKIDANAKIQREHRNYRDFADRFIPFGLRPNVQDVVVGSARSLLVGDFVNRSESLWDLALRGVAAPAVTALIEETLAGWRDQGYAEDAERGAVAEKMEQAGICKPENIRPSYVEFAAEQGEASPAAKIWKQLTSLDQRFRVGPVHGDLHGENVRVRNGQAILIDLASVAIGPLTADLAALETWLAFQVPPNGNGERFADPAWTKEIDRLYAAPTFLHPPGPCLPASPLSWMASVVRQIRTMGIAAQSCPTEYQSTVAAQLLRRCQWDNGGPADRYRRGHGYIVAARLARDAVARSAVR